MLPRANSEASRSFLRCCVTLLSYVWGYVAYSAHDFRHRGPGNQRRKSGNQVRKRLKTSAQILSASPSAAAGGLQVVATIKGRSQVALSICSRSAQAFETRKNYKQESEDVSIA